MVDGHDNGVGPRGWSSVEGMPVVGRTGGGRKGLRTLKGPGKARKAAKRRGKGLSGARKLALGVGAVGTGLLALSVSHCAEAVGLLTGAHWAGAGLMAIGIDAGMVLAELSWLKLGNTEAGYWAQGCVIGSVLLSVVLNAYAFGLHAPDGMVWAAWLLGAAIPAMVYGLGRVVGGLWAE